MAGSVNKALTRFGVSGKLWLEANGERFFGPGPVELLELIQQSGSISKAAKQMGMSYKKAWEIIRSLNSMFGKPLVITQSGGEQGGGSLITDEAQQLIRYHKQLRKRFEAFLEKESQQLPF